MDYSETLAKNLCSKDTHVQLQGLQVQGRAIQDRDGKNRSMEAVLNNTFVYFGEQLLRLRHRRGPEQSLQRPRLYRHRC
jgi:hypothetical protein